MLPAGFKLGKSSCSVEDPCSEYQWDAGDKVWTTEREAHG